MPRLRCLASRARPVLPVALAVVLLLSGLRLLADSGPVRFTASWREREIRVDGDDEDWRGLTQPVAGQHFAVGFVNDEDSLYFCLVSKDDVSLKQVARQGLILWIDPAGGRSKRTFGIRFPGQFAGPSGRTRDAGANRDSVGVDRGVDILGPGRKDVRQVENGTSGITARMRVRGDLLVYEIEVPLRKSEAAAFAPDVDAGAALRVELQTPEWRGPVPLRRGWPMVGVGMGGGPVYPGVDMSALKPLEVIGDLRLATGPSR
jgi:hypothetical protein